jgi:hypothetical protein
MVVGIDLTASHLLGRALPLIYVPSPFANGAGAVCDQKTSKFFVSHREESMAGYVSVKGVYEKLGKGKIKNIK